jgi:hypothetical protein
MNNLEVTWSAGQGVHRLCKSYSILYKGLNRSQILVSTGNPGTNSPWIPGDNCPAQLVALEERKEPLHPNASLLDIHPTYIRSR